MLTNAKYVANECVVRGYGKSRQDRVLPNRKKRYKTWNAGIGREEATTDHSS